MARVIGAASEFYRLRVTRIDETSELDLEWRDDILYREPPRQSVEETQVWRMEAVNVDDEDDVRTIAEYESSEAAHEALADIAEDLDAMTKSQFEEAYIDS